MITVIILFTCVFSYMGFQDSSHFEKYQFSPYKININKEYIRWISGGFLHADMMHLFVNMFVLYMAGESLTVLFSSFDILIFYLSAIVISSVPDFFKNKLNPYYSAIGASGGVSAALFSLLIFSPWEKVYVFFIIPVPFFIFSIIYLYYSYYMSKHNYDNIGHRAHLTGAIYGIIYSAIKVPEALSGFLYSISHPPFISQMLGN